MLLKLKFLAAASAAALAMPAAAQDAAADAAVEADVLAETTAPADAGADAAAQAEAQPAAGAGEIVVATPADLRTGVVVLDPQGGVVGTVEEVDAEGAIVSTGTVRAKMPVASFGKNDRGLVISMTRAQFEAAVEARSPSS